MAYRDTAIARVADNHRTSRQRLRRKLEARGLPRDVIERRVAAKRREQAWRRRFTLRHPSLSASTIDLLVDECAAQCIPLPGETQR